MYWSVLIQGGIDTMTGGQHLGWHLAEPTNMGN